jgi:hypothetical protein
VVAVIPTPAEATVTAEQEQQLESFLQSLTTVPWFADAGRPSTKYQIVADAVVGWDDWNAAMMAVWPPRSMRLEETATRLIGDAAIEGIFSRVDEAIGPAVEAGLRAYFARRPDNTENTECGADLGLRSEIVDSVVRDVSWAAVETALGQPDFFVSLIEVYQEGHWPCAWDGRYPRGTFVVL